jgi:hypothetical protein
LKHEPKPLVSDIGARVLAWVFTAPLSYFPFGPEEKGRFAHPGGGELNRWRQRKNAHGALAVRTALSTPKHRNPF